MVKCPHHDHLGDRSDEGQPRERGMSEIEPLTPVGRQEHGKAAVPFAAIEIAPIKPYNGQVDPWPHFLQRLRAMAPVRPRE